MELQQAKRKFEEYLSDYDRENDKVRLKIVHTYGVTEYSRQIAGRLGLSREDQELAFGVWILFEEGLIRSFIEDGRWDPVIRTAIARHSDFRLEGIEEERELLHARIIRDADKLDNCRVKLEDDIETILGVSEKEVGKTKISREVLEQFRRKESILSSMRKTKMDYWLSYLAYFFDINYKVSVELICEHDYVNRLIGRIPYLDPETRSQMEEVRDMLLQYCADRMQDPSEF